MCATLHLEPNKLTVQIEKECLRLFSESLLCFKVRNKEREQQTTKTLFSHSYTPYVESGNRSIRPVFVNLPEPYRVADRIIQYLNL